RARAAAGTPAPAGAGAGSGAGARARDLGRLVSGRFQATWPALGMVVAVEVTDRAALEHARGVVAEELAAADDAYSPVRADTELARLHEAASRRPAPASPRLC